MTCIVWHILDIGSVSVNAYNTWTLNSTGTAWINKTGYTQLAVREGHDVLDVWPSYTTNQGNWIDVYLSEQNGTTQDPYLNVTYR